MCDSCASPAGKKTGRPKLAQRQSTAPGSVPVGASTMQIKLIPSDPHGNLADTSTVELTRNDVADPRDAAASAFFHFLGALSYLAVNDSRDAIRESIPTKRLFEALERAKAHAIWQANGCKLPR